MDVKFIFLTLDLEKNISIPSLPFPINFRGQPDRIDKLDGVTRIIDYKTGKILPSNLKLSKIENLFSEQYNQTLKNQFRDSSDIFIMELHAYYFF